MHMGGHYPSLGGSKKKLPRVMNVFAGGSLEEQEKVKIEEKSVEIVPLTCAHLWWFIKQIWEIFTSSKMSNHPVSTRRGPRLGL